MSTRVLLCDTAEGLSQLQYALLRSGADLEVEAVTADGAPPADDAVPRRHPASTGTSS